MSRLLCPLVYHLTIALLGSFLCLMTACYDNDPVVMIQRDGELEHYPDGADQITVSLSRLSAIFDCDTGSQGAGDFVITMAVDQVTDSGKMDPIVNFAKKSISLNSGESMAIEDRAVIFRMPRSEGKQFAVTIRLSEEDGEDVEDFSAVRTRIHNFDTVSESWPPLKEAFTHFDTAARTGQMDWTIDQRGQTRAVGLVTNEGCRVTCAYTVSWQTVTK